MASNHQDLSHLFYTQQKCVCRFKPKQGDFNIINKDIPHIGTAVSSSFTFVSFDIPRFVTMFIWCVWLSQVFAWFTSSICFQLSNLSRFSYQGR